MDLRLPPEIDTAFHRHGATDQHDVAQRRSVVSTCQYVESDGAGDERAAENLTRKRFVLHLAQRLHLLAARLSPTHVRVPHIGVEHIVVGGQGIDEHVFPFTDIEHTPQHGIVTGGKSLHGPDTILVFHQIGPEHVRRQPGSESQLRDLSNVLEFFAREARLVLGEIVGNGVVEILEGILFATPVLPVFPGFLRRFVYMAEPVPARGVVGIDCELQSLTVGTQNLPRHQHVGGLGAARNDANRAPVPGPLHGVLQMNRNVSRLAFTNIGENAFLLVALFHFGTGIEGLDADIQKIGFRQLPVRHADTGGLDVLVRYTAASAQQHTCQDCEAQAEEAFHLGCTILRAAILVLAILFPELLS